MPTRINVRSLLTPTPVTARTLTILKRQIESRCPARVEPGLPAPDFTVELYRDESLPPESYSVATLDDRTVRIAGADDRGILLA
jgi:hypothetical protein